MLRSGGNRILQTTSVLKTSIATKKATCKSPKVAVVLSGCGVYDGSEIHEAVAVLSHLTRNGAVPMCFAPKAKQLHVIDHIQGEPMKCEDRCVMIESARISRGNIGNLCDLVTTHASYDGLVFPGGFGVAKNLSDFAEKGIQCTVIPEVVEILNKFHEDRRPIALACIAPILVARVLCGAQITLGQSSPAKDWPFADAILKAKQLGAIVDERDVKGVTFDKDKMIMSTPAYMYGAAQYHEVDDGIGQMIKLMMTIITKGL